MPARTIPYEELFGTTTQKTTHAAPFISTRSKASAQRPVYDHEGLLDNTIAPQSIAQFSVTTERSPSAMAAQAGYSYVHTISCATDPTDIAQDKRERSRSDYACQQAPGRLHYCRSMYTRYF